MTVTKTSLTTWSCCSTCFCFFTTVVSIVVFCFSLFVLFCFCSPWLLLEHQKHSFFAWVVLNCCTFLFRHGFINIWLGFVSIIPLPSYRNRIKSVSLPAVAQHNTRQTRKQSLKLYLCIHWKNNPPAQSQHELSSDVSTLAHLLHCILSGVSLFPYDSLILNGTLANKACSFSNFGNLLIPTSQSAFSLPLWSPWVRQCYL